MDQDAHIVEIAIFTIKEDYLDKVGDIRRQVRASLEGFPGLLEIIPLTPADDSNRFADIARWETLETALAAASAFESGDERFIPYIDAIESLEFMGHFRS